MGGVAPPSPGAKCSRNSGRRDPGPSEARPERREIGARVRGVTEMSHAAALLRLVMDLEEGKGTRASAQFSRRIALSCHFRKARWETSERQRKMMMPVKEISSKAAYMRGICSW